MVLNDVGSGMGGFRSAPGTCRAGSAVPTGKEMQILSYVQTRGSVPAYWAEVNTLKYTPKVQIRSIEAACLPPRRTSTSRSASTATITSVNLVNQKGREVRVKQAYEEMVDKLVIAPQGAHRGRPAHRREVPHHRAQPLQVAV